MNQNYAHSNKNDISKWQTLEEHLEHVSSLAGRFAQPFGAPLLASVLGGIHDCGKASLEFQNYLQETYDTEESDEEEGQSHSKGPDHSTAAAQWLHRNVIGMGALLAYTVAGHHSGLPDGIPTLNSRLDKQIPEWQSHFSSNLPDVKDIQQACKQEVPKFLQSADSGFSMAFFLRMLYSSLVDADFLDTERFMDSERSQTREQEQKPSMAQLLEKLENYYKILDDTVRQNGRRNDAVMVIRNEVRMDCEKAAEKAPGQFTLKVPTGGGKTLSSMLFALKHACKHKMDRIIYVVPFTTIIEQTADVYRHIFGDDAVLEIHCNTDPDAMTAQSKLLCENWDAPIIITTNVQFFESMFANKPSRCRKLHNYANAVVILDEAQGLPVEMLKPCLKALEELTCNYNTSVVLCTATLPVFFDKQILGGSALTGLSQGVVDIVGSERHLHSRLKRVNVVKIAEPITDHELVERLAGEESVLIVVNTRRHARELYELVRTNLSDRCVFHLSAQMCGVHRINVLNDIKACLKNHGKCMVISTQLIEAGVDIDFPCVYRDIAGVDSMTQAAGRCNREGKLVAGGKMVLFESKDFAPPRGMLRMAAQYGRLTTLLPEVADDLLGPLAVTKYYEALYSSMNKGILNGMDKYGVLSDLIPLKLSLRGKPEDLLVFRFRELGEKFKLIDTVTTSVIVPYDKKGRELCEQLRSEYSPSEQRRLARKLQRYTVSLFGLEPMDSEGHPIAEKVHDTYWILTSPELYYTKELGLRLSAEAGCLEV